MTNKQALTFFIVDDDPDMVSIMTVILEAAGHTARSTVAGANAITDIAAAGGRVFTPPSARTFGRCRER